MFPSKALFLLCLGLSLCPHVLMAAELPIPAMDFPLPVDSYHDEQIPSIFGKLTRRIQISGVQVHRVVSGARAQKSS